MDCVNCEGERTPVPPSSPERAPVPEFSPERAPVSPYSPKRASVLTSSSERAPVPTSSPERAPVLPSRPESPKAHNCLRSCLLLLPPPLLSSSPLLALSPPSMWSVIRGSAILHDQRGWGIPCLRLQPLSPRLCLSPSTRWLHHGF